MATTVTLRWVENQDYLMFEMPSNFYRQSIINTLNKCKEKTSGYVTITINRPYKPRTTGDGSQNNLIWKLITIIANEVGDDSEGMKDTENGIKMRALSRGYPYHINKITGEQVPNSMRDINTVECSYLIDTAMQICSELGIVLPSELTQDEPKLNDMASLATQALGGAK